MSDYVVSTISEKARVKLLESHQELPADLEMEVAKIWEQEIVPVFNGRVLSCVGVHGDVIIAKEVEYRQVLAVTRAPELRERLGVMPLSVLGIMIRGDEVLLGKRSQHVTQYAGQWEFVPAGALDIAHASNFHDQLFDELLEETRLTKESIERVEPFAVLHDLFAPCADICAFMYLKSGVELPSLEPVDEVDEWCWVKIRDLPQVEELIEAYKSIVPFVL